MYQLKKNTPNYKVSAVTSIGFFVVHLHEATQEQLKALAEIGHKDVEFNPKKKAKKVEENSTENTDNE